MKRRLAVLFAVLVAGCAGTRGPVVRPEPAVLIVDNRSYPDMVIYAVDGARRVRLGTATGNLTTKLRIPDNVVATGRDVMFVADPIGSNRASVSNRIFVRPGQEVTLIINP